MKKRVSIFKKFINSIYNMNEYMNYIKEGLFRTILYAFVLSIFLGGIKGVVQSVQVNSVIDETIAEVNSDEFQFSVEDGLLNIDNSPVKIDESNTLIYIDKDISINDTESLESLIVNSDTYLLVLQDGIVMSSNMDEATGTSAIQVSYADMENVGITLNNESVANILEEVKTPIMVVEVIMFIFREFMLYMMTAVLIAIFALLPSKLLGLNLKLSEVFALVVYAATLPNLLVTGLNIIMPDIFFDTAGMIGTLAYTYIILRHLRIQKNTEIKL